MKKQREIKEKKMGRSRRRRENYKIEDWNENDLKPLIIIIISTVSLNYYDDAFISWFLFLIITISSFHILIHMYSNKNL